MSILTEVLLICSLLNSDQPRGAVEKKCRITPIHFQDFDTISVATRKTESYAKKKSVHRKVGLYFLHQIIVNNLMA